MISIITPHFNDFEGLERIYGCLKEQSSNSWEWLVVDDMSDESVRNSVEDFFQSISDHRVQLILNSSKTNASLCRNIGIDHATHEHLVFLDSDDFIANDFVANRLIPVDEFVVFRNYNIVDEKNEVFSKGSEISNPIDCFLSANFVWQTTCILWNKAFLTQIGSFDPNLKRLQDVELSIRALIVGKNYKFLDNKIDFFYCTKPIRTKPHIVSESCASVNYLISKIRTNYAFDAIRHSMLKSYYYALVKSLHRSKNRNDVIFVQESLKLFWKKKYLNTLNFIIGKILLVLYKYHLITDSLFLKVNRYFFK